MKVLNSILVLLVVIAFVSLVLCSGQNSEPHFENGQHNPTGHTKEESAFAKEIRDLVTQHQVFVFSKSYCPHCKRAKQLLNDNNVPFGVVEIDLRSDGPALHAELKAITSRNTVPNIWVNGKPFGGGDDLVAAWKNGKFQELLAQKN